MLAFTVSFTIFLEFAQTFATVTSHLHLDGRSGLRRNIHVKKNQVSYGHFAVERFHRLQGSVGLSIDVSNYRECALSCVNNPPCTSFNVASSPRPEGKFRCELLNEDKYSASPGQLTRSQEYHYYSIKTPCSSFPCQNEGTCAPNYEENQYHCGCTPGYHGKNCETDVNECSSDPCLNGGTCVDQVNGYVCKCHPGYEGARCQTNINECSSNPCQNGGTCVDQVNGYVCNCQPGYYGVRCSHTNQWTEYTPYFCGISNRNEIKRRLTEQECKQLCSACVAIEYWSGGNTACYECFDKTQRYHYPNTNDGSYPPHVFVKN